MPLFLPRPITRSPIWRAELVRGHPIVSYFDAAWSFAEQEPRELVSNTTTAWIQRDSRIVRTPFGVGATVPTGDFAYRTVALDSRFPYVALVLAYKQSPGSAQEDLYALGDNQATGAFVRLLTTGTPLTFSAFYRSTNGAGLVIVTGPRVFTGLVAMALHIPNGTATNARLFVNGVAYTGTGTNQANTNVTFDHESVGGLRVNTDVAPSRNNTVLFAARGRRSTVDQEVLRQWTINPFSIFRPANSPVFFSLPSAGAFTLALDAGSYSLTGQDPGLTSARSMALDAGAYNLTGNGVDFSVGRIIYLDAGSYSVSGQDPGLTSARSLVLDAGAYSVTGNDVTLVYSAGTVAYSLTLDAGSYSITGLDPTLASNRNLTLDAGSYALTGNDVTFSSALSFPLDTGVYTLSGLPVGLVWSGAPVEEVTDRIITLRSLTERWRM